MVNADDAQRRALSVGGKVDGHGRLVEGGGDVVDGDRVVRVGAVKIWLGTFVDVNFGVNYDLRVGADVADDGQSPLGRRQGLNVDEGGNRSAQVDAAGAEC